MLLLCTKSYVNANIWIDIIAILYVCMRFTGGYS